METVQDFFIKDLLEDDYDEGQNETVELLGFLKKNSTTVTKEQVEAYLLLREMGLEDLANYSNAMRENTVPSREYFNMVSKLTLADRIKGNAKLSHLMKANADPLSGFKPVTEHKQKPLKKV